MLPILQGLSHCFYPSVIACQYICVDLHLKELSTLEQVKNRFFRSLRLVRDWHDNQIADHGSLPPTSAILGARRQSQHRGTLEQYVNFLVQRLHVNGNDDFVNVSGTMVLLQWLCLTLAYHNQSRTETETYLELLDCYLGEGSQRSPQSGDLTLHPTQVISLIAYTSNMTMGQSIGLDSQDIQSRICADSVDGSKIVPYLSRDIRQRLLTGLASVASGEESAFCVSEDMLAEMSAEIATSWWRKNQSLRMGAVP